MKNKSLKVSTNFSIGRVFLLAAFVLLSGVFGYFSQRQTSAQIADKSAIKQNFYGPEFFKNSGEVDTSFETNLLNEFDSGVNVNAILKQPDGKLLIAGSFANVGGFSRRGLVRLNPDFSLDRSFDIGAGSSSFSVLAIQSDGKILVGGSITFSNGFRSGIFRLNTDGSLDTSFEINSTSISNIQTIIPLPNGKILITGSFSNIGEISFPGIALLSADGNLDESFNPGVITNSGSQFGINTAAVQPDGKILITGSFTSISGSTRNRIARLNADGTLDLSFDTGIGPNAQINVILPLANGKILIGGDFTSVNGAVRNKIARLNADGGVDGSFNFNSPGEISVRTMILQPDGKILVSIINSFSSSIRTVFRLNTDGSNDATFEAPAGTSNTGINGSVNSLILESDGKILIGGSFSFVGNAPRRGVARLNPNGSVDTAFVIPLGANGTVNVIAVQPDGKILISGNFSYVNGFQRNRVARLNPDGSVDTTFSVQLNTNNSCCGNIVNAIVVQPDGKILISGNFASVNNSFGTGGFARLNADGSTDTSFNRGISSGNVQAIAVQTDGKILIGGGFFISGSNPNFLARLNANGSLDNTFLPAIPNTPTGPNGGVARIVLQNDGKVIITGTFDSYSGVQRRGIARVNTDGSLDTSFNADLSNSGGGSIFALVVQPDGKVLLGGTFSQINGVNRNRLARLNADGSLDTTFGTIFGQEGGVNAIILQPDGKILVGGSFNSVFGAIRRRIVRLNPDGSVDSIFNPGSGANAEILALARQSDGRVLIGGNFTVVDGVARTGIARLRVNACVVSPLFDFDGDGKTDISLYRPGGGDWYRLNTTNGSLNRQLFGLPTDRIVPGDYDGDGRTDIAVFRPSEGTWYILNSRTGFQTFRFGTSGDIPIAADFDGDERDDLAVFRPSNGTWYIQRSSLGFTAVNFGLATDVPVIADFDGDCKADIAVFRPSNGTWYWLQSSNGGFRAVQFGTSGDIPVAGDYDGDGRTDTAVYRPSAGTWYLLKSQEGFAGLQFGINTDRPVPADYDGDGETDIAVFRNGIWYILRSLDAKVQTVSFGVTDDQPIPAAYLPR